MVPLEIVVKIMVAIIFVGFWLIAFVIIYHFSRFGIGTQPKKLAAIFLMGSVVLFCTSVIFYNNLDLSTLPQLPSLSLTL